MVKKYIDLNTCLGTKAKNDFEKDYFKLTKNSVFGKANGEYPDEVIESFVGISSKCYTFKTKKNVVKKVRALIKL